MFPYYIPHSRLSHDYFFVGGGKVYSQFGWGATAGFATSGSATGLHSPVFPLDG